MRNITIKSIINKKNNNIKLFTPGPASLLEENILGLAPCFGRGDKNYLSLEKKVFFYLKKISGQPNVISTQGSGTTGLEIVALNFLRGDILIIKTGYYSDRLLYLASLAKKTHKFIKKIYYVDWKKLKYFKKKIEWIWGCYTETSIGFKLDIDEIKKNSIRLKSKLALDATASIGLEKKHNYADVVSFSSCKGLFGLTGASFVAFKKYKFNEVDSFVLKMDNLLNKKMTGPYHVMQSLYYVLKDYKNFKKAVIKNKEVFLKKYSKYLIFSKINQANLCTYINKKILKRNSKTIIYEPRVKLPGSIVSHLGEVHLGSKAKGKILENLKLHNK